MNKVVNNVKLFDILSNLRDRWNCEKGCEDFADYSKVIEKAVKPLKGVNFISAQKSPFGFKADIGNQKVSFFIKIIGFKADKSNSMVFTGKYL